MLTPKKQPDTWQEALKIINRCPVCTTQYTPESAALFAREDKANLVHITCPSCQSYFVALIVLLGHGMSSVGMVTDLSLSDVQRLFKKDPLTTDEIIAHYEELHTDSFMTLVAQNTN